MSYFYLDSSALAKRYLQEIGSNWIQSLVDPETGNIILTAEITRIEVAAALSARHRSENGISQEERDNAVSLLIDHCNTEYMMVPADTLILDRALGLTQKYRLRGYDAVQLAAALVVNDQFQDNDLPGVTFVAADHDLIAAAISENLTTENPNQHS